MDTKSLSATRGQEEKNPRQRPHLIEC